MHEPDEQGFIPFIHNYCDRRCERCRFVRQCRVGAVEVDDVGEAEDAIADETPEDMRRRLMKLMGLSEEDIAALEAEDQEPVEEDPVEAAREAEEMAAYHAEAAALDRLVEARELNRLAMAYMDLVHAWIEERAERFEARGIQVHPRAGIGIPVDLRTADAMLLSEAVQEILWFHTLLPAKVSRALHGKLGDRVPELDHPTQSDHNGTAKVCLDGVVRSIAAWGTLINLLPEEGDAAVPMQECLQRMREELDREFPDAMAFIRPGFDAPQGID